MNKMTLRIKGYGYPRLPHLAILSCMLMTACDQSSIQTTGSEEFDPWAVLSLGR
ncbi:hypothetical protein J1785_00375 [Rahnella sp. SL6]|uniref:hypothetical protein n=1 Tax=Rahnella perminowiae TaxID=2816244 RepID=UPI001C26AD6D|nr:hypothetical protein [Rahnella perminowiae]MBU9808248.1 hypothetical protein [Rahnella perminowiae]